MHVLSILQHAKSDAEAVASSNVPKCLETYKKNDDLKMKTWLIFLLNDVHITLPLTIQPLYFFASLVYVVIRSLLWL